MGNFFVLGDTGFIGSSFLNTLKTSNARIIGINQNSVNFIQGSISKKYSRKSNDLFSELKPYLEPGDYVINAIWGKNDRHNRQSLIHDSYASQEMKFINQILNFSVKYLSFGSIAECSDEQISPSRDTLYSKSKHRIHSHLINSDIKYIWLRVASCYGEEDRRNWLMTQLGSSWESGVDLRLENPNQLLNLCHVDSLVVAALSLLKSDQSGAFNLTTNQWLTVAQIKECFYTLKEPTYLIRNSGNFSPADPESLLVSTPQLTKYFSELRASYKS